MQLPVVSCALALLVAIATTAATPTPAATKCFPPDFLFGSATAAYQVEGGWNATGRTPSIWDDFCRAMPTLQCANVADDFVHRYKQDIALMVETGLSSFRFSVSWSRAMNWDPTARRMTPNALGLAFYHDVIDTLLAHGIAPILTLYHWDLPRELQLELDGWLNRDLADHFQEYADLLYREYGAKVEYWSTFNEPHSFVWGGYSRGMAPPALPPSDTNAYVATHNVLLAHALAVQRFRALKSSNVIHANAKISIVLNADFAYPLDPSNEVDVAAASRRMEFAVGWFLQPVVSGEYPAVMRERVGDRLPTFSPEEKQLLKGSYDLFMLNHYASNTHVDCESPQSTIPCDSLPLGWDRDLGVDGSRMPDGARSASPGPDGKPLCAWFSAYPEGYLETIRWLHMRDPAAPILLTENGWCGNATIDNRDQLWYFQSYLDQVHTAITVDKIPVVGYTAWSFMDNYEWGSFQPRFGLYYVNYTQATGSKQGYTPLPTDLTRTPRTAATWYAQVAKTKCMEVSGAVMEGKTVVAVSTKAAVIAFAVVVVGATAVVLLRRRRSTSGENEPLLRQ